MQSEGRLTGLGLPPAIGDVDLCAGTQHPSVMSIACNSIGDQVRSCPEGAPDGVRQIPSLWGCSTTSDIHKDQGLSPDKGLVFKRELCSTTSEIHKDQGLSPKKGLVFKRELSLKQLRGGSGEVR